MTPKEPCALLLPLIDPTDPLAKLPNLSGPFEVIVIDPALNQEYKRQVHLLVVAPEVHFALPTPSITLTLAAVCEIVLECDVRLTTKDVFQAFYDNPLAKPKAQLKEVCSDPIWGHAAIYGYRAVQEQSKEKHDLVHQCLLKVQQKHRIPLLSASGHGDLVVRDFVAKGEYPSFLVSGLLTGPTKQISSKLPLTSLGIEGLLSPNRVWRHGLPLMPWPRPEIFFYRKMTGSAPSTRPWCPR